MKKRIQEKGQISSPSGNLSFLPSHSERYIQFRKRFKGLSPKTSPSKSNLTLTSQMINSIQSIVQEMRIIFIFSNKFANQKAEWIYQRGRNFLNISKKEFEEFEKNIEKFLNK